MQLVPEGMSKDIKGVVALWTIGVKGSKSKDGDTKAKSTDLDSLIVWQHIAVTKCSKRKRSEHSKTMVNEVKTKVEFHKLKTNTVFCVTYFLFLQRTYLESDLSNFTERCTNLAALST